MNREEIKAIIPHREPMLLVDEAVVTGSDTATGRYTVRGDEFFVQGHFPGNPTVPGVILCEMMAQASCVLLADLEALQGATPYFTKLDNAKFRRPVKPGDTLETRCRVTRIRGAFVFVEAEGFVGDTLACSGSFAFALVK